MELLDALSATADDPDGEDRASILKRLEDIDTDHPTMNTFA